MLKTKLAAAVLVALSFGPCAAFAHGRGAHDATGQAGTSGVQQDTMQSADDGNHPTPDSTKAKKLEAVTVTGSLIPQTEIETATPITTITAADIKARGFTTVAEALQQSSFATGSVQGSQFSAGFTPTAQTLSMFGMPVGFVKYLIDGRPMGNFPGLYNGSDVFNNLSGIPTEMVDRIEILPGGQSSLYGSDAIAGVVNIILKKHLDGGPVVDARYGWHSDGGGASRRISVADNFSAGRFNLLVGGQFESTQPIWRRDRDLTAHYYTHGTSPAVASRDYLVLGYFTGYHFFDPDNCSGLTDQWYGNEGKRHRAGKGDYCGSFTSPGYATLTTDNKQANFYTHATFDVNDNLQLYGDLLYNYQEQKYTNGADYTWWGTNVVTAAAGGGYFWDPRIGDYMLVQRNFSPEEVGGYKNIMSKDTENSYMLTLGAKGTLGQSAWDYELSFMHSDDKLQSRVFQRFTKPIEDYFASHVMGPQMGTYYGYPVFQPDYEALYHPVSNADFLAFTGYTEDNAKTWDNLLRAQLTNGSLFSLPGGDAGIAMVLEGGNEGWDSTPDPRLLQDIDYNGNQVPYVWGWSATPGAGHRSRYAATTELRLPVLSQLTLDVSGRYDSYKVASSRVSHKTYNFGIEYRPFETLLLRGRYGTAFKVPTLSDEFQGLSGYYSSVTDYLNCGRLGFSGANIDQCPTPYDNEQFNGHTSGNPALKPITAKVWTYGFVWAPTPKLSFNVDYLHWDISNEVAQVSADQLSNTQYLCDIGTLDMNSTTCSMAFSLVTRGPGQGNLLGHIISIATPKQNVANEKVNALTAGVNYVQDIGRFGQLALNLSYSDMFKHTYQDYPTDEPVDLLRHPNWSTDFKSKANGSITWSNAKWSTTLYANRFGSTPNYLASSLDNYTSPGTGRLGPWTLYNASVTFNPTKALGLSLMVNNLFNKMPPRDTSYSGLTAEPYNIFNYNVFGRAIYVEASYKFGR